MRDQGLQLAQCPPVFLRGIKVKLRLFTAVHRHLDDTGGDGSILLAQALIYPDLADQCFGVEVFEVGHQIKRVFL
ncbi:hypothetical protein AAFO90_22345 [Phaeobacter sp. CAU 1743]|uniref:hypothetical protein n=1 Tax=Phaeobacter sp. CAU 1743 TaxID=3140367 RepID=UPI0023B4DE13